MLGASVSVEHENMHSTVKMQKNFTVACQLMNNPGLHWKFTVPLMRTEFHQV